VVILEDENALSEKMRGEMINKRVACVRTSETDKHIVYVVLILDSERGVIGRRSVSR